MSGLTMRVERAASGELRHVPAPRPPASKGRGKKERAPRDPLKASSVETGVAGAQLIQLIERVERLEEEKKGIADDIKDVYAEAKSTGFDTKTMKTIVQLRKMEKHHRDEAEILLETYMVSIGLK